MIVYDKNRTLEANTIDFGFDICEIPNLPHCMFHATHPTSKYKHINRIKVRIPAC